MLRTFLIFCLSSSFIFADASYTVGTDYVVLHSVVPASERRPKVIDKKPIKIIDNELFADWMETLFLNDWILKANEEESLKTHL